MSDLLDRLQADLTVARKAQDKPRTLLLGTVLADMKNKRIEARRDLTDDDVTEVLRKAIKRRRESVEMYEKHARPELAANERGEAEALEAYLPVQVGDDEIRSIVNAAIETGPANIGAVMGAVLPQLKGRAEGSRISAIVREELGRRA